MFWGLGESKVHTKQGEQARDVTADAPRPVKRGVALASRSRMDWDLPVMYKQSFKCWRILWRALGPHWCLQRHVHVLKDVLEWESGGQAINKTQVLTFDMFCTCKRDTPTSSPDSKAADIKTPPLLRLRAVVPEAKRTQQGSLCISALSLILDQKLVSFTFPRCCTPCTSPSAAEVTPGHLPLGTSSAWPWANSWALPTVQVYVRVGIK